jgi:hypothetical protein
VGKLEAATMTAVLAVAVVLEVLQRLAVTGKGLG